MEEWVQILAACQRRADGALEIVQDNMPHTLDPNLVLWHLTMKVGDHDPPATADPWRRLDTWLRHNRTTNSRLARASDNEDRVETWPDVLRRTLSDRPSLLPQLLEALGKMRWFKDFVRPTRPSSRYDITFSTRENMYDDLKFTHNKPLGPLIHWLVRQILPEMGCRQPPTQRAT